MGARFAVIAFLAGPSLALGQTASLPSESVTVTVGKYPQSVIRSFVDTHVAPTRMANKLARWKDTVCPQVVGLTPNFAGFIRQHILDVARVGAPANARERCRPNMHVVFTTTPQELMNTVRRKYPDVLGYYDSSAQADRMAEMTNLIQAWYVTATVDLRGNVFPDTRRPGGLEICMPNPMPGAVPPCLTMIMPNARPMNVTGSRLLGDGLSSAFVHVLVVANPDKLITHEMGTLGDYIAMLALSQQPKPDGCQPVPSILNLLEAQCPQVMALSDVDVAYLTALYRMGARDSLQQQRDQLVSAINRSVGEP